MRPYILSAAFLGALALTAGQQGAMAQATNLDTAAIEEAIGLKGQLIKEENVFKVSKPRTDVKVAVDQWTMPPFMGLGSWAAFTPAHGGAMLMGDTVVFEDEINPAMSVAFNAGLEVTALHDHFFFDEPKVFFMHIGGHGDAKALAAGVKKVYDKIAEIRVANPSPAKSFTGTIASPNSITSAPLEAALGVKGQSNQGMFKIVISRTASMHGVSVAKEMGINTWASFGGSDDAAVVDGDFAMLENELQPVLHAMRKEGINIVAIHQHMSHEQPYYLVGANALEDNVVLYKTVNGVRSSLNLIGQNGGYGVKTAMSANQWHTLRVEFAGTASTSSPTGLWSKADSITAFSGFS